MAERTYKVGNASSRDKRTNEVFVDSYFVTDAHNEAELNGPCARPKVAEFPISQMYDKETQMERAERFAEFMNKLADAARIAKEQTHLIDILSR